jgi:hypothetical protein
MFNVAQLQASSASKKNYGADEVLSKDIKAAESLEVKQMVKFINELKETWQTYFVECDLFDKPVPQQVSAMLTH